MTRAERARILLAAQAAAFQGDEQRAHELFAQVSVSYIPARMIQPLKKGK